MSDACPSRSPESDQPCVLPDKLWAHRYGQHESVDGSRSWSWPTRPEDHVRWDPRCHLFGEGTSARHIIAETLSRRQGFGYIPPAVWSSSGAVVKMLRGEGFDLNRKRRARA